MYHGERMNSIDFGGYRSKVKVTMGIIDKCGVRRDAMLCVVIFSFSFQGKVGNLWQGRSMMDSNIGPDSSVGRSAQTVIERSRV